MESDATTSGALMGRVLQLSPQLRDELRAWAEVGCAVKGPLHALTQRATACEIGATHRTRVQVTQNLVVRFGEELLAEKRISPFHERRGIPWVVSDVGPLTIDCRRCASSARSNARPRWSRDITVPSGIASASAISLYVNSSTSQRTITS